MKDLTSKSSARVGSGLGSKPSSRIGSGTSAATGVWKCSQCGCALAKDAALTGKAELKDGNLLCRACRQPVRHRNVAGAVIAGVASVMIVLAVMLVLHRQHAASEAQTAAWRADESGVDRALNENRYLDAKSACTALAASYQKAYDGNVPADAAARLENLRGRYQQWLTEHYGPLDTSGINTVEQILRVLPGTTLANQTRLLSFTMENNRLKLSAVSSPRPPLGENDPQPGTSLYRDPIVAEGDGLVAFVLQSDPSLEAVKLEWQEPVGGELQPVKTYSITRAQLPELLRLSAPMAGAREMNAARKR